MLTLYDNKYGRKTSGLLSIVVQQKEEGWWEILSLVGETISQNALSDVEWFEEDAACVGLVALIWGDEEDAPKTKEPINIKGRLWGECYALQDGDDYDGGFEIEES